VADRFCVRVEEDRSKHIDRNARRGRLLFQARNGRDSVFLFAVAVSASSRID
jgi:hypothetical protein